MADTILVYRDFLGVRSEAFIQRQYCAFKALTPLYVGTKRGPLTPPDATILAPPGLLGWPQRLAFRQFGHIPAKLETLIAQRQPKLIHAQFGLGGALALPIAHAAHLPLVVTFHGGDATKDSHFRDRPIVPTIFQRRRAALAVGARAIFCVSRFVRDRLLARGFPENKLEVHYLGIDMPGQGASLPKIGISNTVLFVGRLVAKKGIDTLIDAMAAARLQAPGLELMVVGDGKLRFDLKRQAERLGVPARFMGWQAEDAVKSAMRQALLLAVPSRAAQGGDAEGLPTVIMEAMALGVPVAATRHAGIPEIVSDGVTGLLVPESDAPALAQAILTVKSDPALAGRLRGEAFADMRARFDAKRQSALLERRLMEIVSH